ncbi:MAG: AraC family transcription regulator [Ilumatobacteraceae bacterium]|nr:AraC family transcription regulator [Ilumatobacteraceae bacterium]
MYQERSSRLAGAVVWTSVGDGRAKRILPDGSMDVIWDGTSLFVAGPDTTAQVVPARPGNVSVGLRFAPGTAPTVLGVAAHELVDQRAELEDVWSTRAVRPMVDRLAAGDDAGRLLEEIAIDRLAGTDGPPPIVDAITAMLDRGDPVPDVAAEVGLSARQLQRRCIDAYGYGPKMLARILRLQRAIGQLRLDVPRAHAAAITGYADQAHLAREVRELAGTTIGDLLS